MTSTLHSPTLAIPGGSPGIEREIVEPRRRTLAVTAFATLVALAAFTTSPATMTQTVASLGGGTLGPTWGLSAMGLGPAAMLDCTCGIGTQAIGLARQGFPSDRSGEVVSRRRGPRRAVRELLRRRTARCLRRARASRSGRLA
jgi:hypothetical protein